MTLSVSQWVGVGLLGVSVLYLISDRKKETEGPMQTKDPMGGSKPVVRSVEPGPDQPDTLKPGEKNFEEY